MQSKPQNSCFFSGCRKIPSLVCKCENKITFSCPKHIEEHSYSTRTDHQITMAAITTLKGLEKSKFLSKLDEIVKELNKISIDAVSACSEIISGLNQSITKFISKIQDQKANIVNARKIIQADKPINNDFVAQTMKMNDLKLDINQTGIKDEILNMFSVVTESYDNYIFFALENDSNLYTVNLETLKKEIFANFSKCWYCSSATRVYRDQYFITCGYQSTPYLIHGYTSLISLKHKTEIVLESSTPSLNNSCILKDNEVYIFGGKPTVSIYSDAALKFNINSRSWTNLAKMPTASLTCSTLIDDKIVIAGYSLNCAYVYQNDAYAQNLNLIPYIYYHACSKWIICKNYIYECQDLDNTVWDAYDINIPNNYSPLNIAYMRNSYVYLVLYPEEIWRVDTINKAAERLNIN